jgi:hypothetical protein
LILAGSDPYHPTPISRELAQLAPRAQLVEGWKEALPSAIERARNFLETNAAA